MAGQTTDWHIPYPTGTDRVTDGDNAIQAVAGRVETIWNGTNDSVVSGNGSSCNPTAACVPMRRANIVTVPVEFGVAAPGIGAGDIIAQVTGALYMPIVTITVPCVGYSSGALIFLSFRTNGQIICNTAVPAGVVIYGTATYCAANG